MRTTPVGCMGCCAPVCTYACTRCSPDAPVRPAYGYRRMRAGAWCRATASAPPAPTRHSLKVLLLVPRTHLQVNFQLCCYFCSFSLLRKPVLTPPVQVFIVPVMNPDGFNAGLRENANGVDLNRNALTKDFPYGGYGSWPGAALYAQEQGVTSSTLPTCPLACTPSSINSWRRPLPWRTTLF